MPATRRRDVARRVRSSGLSTTTLPFRAGVSGVRHPKDLAWLLPGWQPGDATPAPATEREALGWPPFGRGVELICSALAGTQLRAVRWNADLGIHERLAEQPHIITDPNPLSDPWQWKFAVGMDLVLYGNTFGLFGDLDWHTQRPGWVVPVPADQVWMVVDDDTGLWSWIVGGVEFGLTELLHISSGNRSGEVLGAGALRRYADWLGGGIAAETHSAGYFAGGALPPAVISSTSVLTEEQGIALKSKWRTLTATREPVVLPSNITLTPVVSDAEKAQLVEARTWNAQLAAMMLGIPPTKLGLDGPTMTYQNVEQVDIDWTRDTVARWADPIAAALTKWMLPAGTSALWDWAGRLRNDAKTTTDVLVAQAGANIVTVDEARATLGRPPLERTTDPGTTPEGVPELTHQEVY